ncbi:MAG: hypothetical protein LBT59_09275 [Clostridiales bacterium]|nr:hypothetical protein [Clostridiales bacterium]
MNLALRVLRASIAEIRRTRLSTIYSIERKGSIKGFAGVGRKSEVLSTVTPSEPWHVFSKSNG